MWLNNGTERYEQQELFLASDCQIRTNSNAGSDMMLIRIVDEAFKSSGWPTQIQTGRYTFPLGNNSRNVRDEAEDLYCHS